MSPTFRAHIAAVGLSLCVVACVKEPPPPLLAFSGDACASAPDLTAASPLQVDKEAIKLKFDASSKCIKRPGDEARSYVMLKLPESTEGFILSVDSEPEGKGIFIPDVLMLAADGRVLRTLTHENYMPRNDNLSLNFRVRPGEKFALLQSSAKGVGKTDESIHSDIQVTSTGQFVLYTGSEKKRQLVYSYNGTVRAAAYLVPKAK